MNSPGIARFYSGDKCVEEIPCASEREAEKLSDHMYQGDDAIDDWTWTEDNENI